MPRSAFTARPRSGRVYPPTLVGVRNQICRSSEARGAAPLARAPGYVQKSYARARSRPTFCVFALKTRTKTHTHTLTSFRTSYVCHFRRVFRAKTNPCLFVWGVFAFRPKNTYENTHLPLHRFRHQVGVSFQTCLHCEKPTLVK